MRRKKSPLAGTRHACLQEYVWAFWCCGCGCGCGDETSADLARPGLSDE
eukprot:CAMPEP_0206492088 /NCGR_PEP_ID=MMETSP0324_2-20121206/45692_1 /ASSEMBLY_ACC=CAM_ASM_000836 /TAXON_ID=2866 /ORGANISM="Crypthecodinium cohnii, Strain Seligo" /LENGTH=48 /DNA_ID= /DNA_START= /DNA_END= /DNA_ORIENTATION=